MDFDGNVETPDLQPLPGGTSSTLTPSSLSTTIEVEVPRMMGHGSEPVTITAHVTYEESGPNISITTDAEVVGEKEYSYILDIIKRLI